jgi:D-Tyr-tRNAtyr deacylase
MLFLLPAAVQVAGIDGEVLLVSQFTLYGRLKKPKPDYSKAMGPDKVGPEGIIGVWVAASES